MECLEELSLLTADELLEQYINLYEKYNKLKIVNEQDTQRIHELKRNLETATASQAYLEQELEHLVNNNKAGAKDKTLRAEIEELRRKCNAAKLEQASLQQDYDAIYAENVELRKKLKDADLEKVNKEKNKFVVNNELTNEYAEQICLLERQNGELLKKLGDCEESNVQSTFVLAEREKNIAILQDQVVCLEENLNSKRDELEENLQLLESTQEQLAEANGKLMMLSSAPANVDRKGNSLFAEVDDQRQAMMQLLNTQKRSYLKMKKIYSESENEIRRLKRENIAIHTELETCCSIFCKADKTYQDKLTEHLGYLNQQNSELELKYKRTLDNLRDVANDKGVVWLGSMLNYCKQETDNVRSQLHSIRLKKASLEEQLRNSQQEIARWRFETLKHRCVLFDRENLLTENNIAFKSVNELQYKVTHEQLNSAKPQITNTIQTKNLANPQLQDLNISNQKQNNAAHLLDATNDEVPKAVHVVECSPMVNRTTTTKAQCDEVQSAANTSITSVTGSGKSQYEEVRSAANISIKSVTGTGKAQCNEVRCTANTSITSVTQTNDEITNLNRLVHENIENINPITVKASKIATTTSTSIEYLQQADTNVITSNCKLTPSKLKISEPCSILASQNDFKEQNRNVKSSQNLTHIHHVTPYKTKSNNANNASINKQSNTTKSKVIVRRINLTSKQNQN